MKQKTEVIYSNLHKHQYKLTPTELRTNDKGRFRDHFVLSRSTLHDAGLPPTDVANTITVMSPKSDSSFRLCTCYLRNSRLTIGCRTFDKSTSKKLLRWAGLLH